MPKLPALLLIPALVLSLTARSAPPLVIAHRGASGYLPEHTLAAKTLAYEMGADYLEQDVVLTRDDVPVVMHDVELETTTDVAERFPDRKRADGHYYALDFTLSEIKQLQAHERTNPKTGMVVFPKRFPLNQSSFQVPTLEEELQLIAGLNKTLGRRVGIYPELKQPAWHRRQGHDLSRIVLPILRRHGYATKADACWLQCFELDELKRIRTELGWQGRLLLLLGSGKRNPDGSQADPWFTPAGLAEAAKTVDGVGPSLHAIVTGKSPAERAVTDFVTHAHAAKLAVHPYTLRADDLPKVFASMADAGEVLFNQAGIDGLFTDFPDLVVQWRAAHGKPHPTGQ